MRLQDLRPRSGQRHTLHALTPDQMDTDSRYPNIQPIPVLSLIHLLQQRRLKHARSQEPMNPPTIPPLRGELIIHADEDRSAGRDDVECGCVVPDWIRGGADLGGVAGGEGGGDGAEGMGG